MNSTCTDPNLLAIHLWASYFTAYYILIISLDIHEDGKEVAHDDKPANSPHFL